MIKKVMVVVMTALFAIAYGQDSSTDSTTVQETGRIAAFTNSLYAYGQYSISFLTKAKNSVVAAYEKDTHTRWNAGVDAVYMNLRWSEYMADEWTYQYVLTDIPPNRKTPGFWELDYGSSYTPIIVSLPAKVSPVVNLSYKGSQWSVGVRGWYFNEIAQRSGTVESIGWIESGDTTYLSVSGVRMWAFSLFPLRNMLYPSTFTPVNWWAGNAMRFITTEAYTSYKIHDALDFIIALKAIDVENKQILGQSHWAYVQTWSGYIWDNHVTLNQRAEASYRALGPMVGVDFHAGPVSVRYQTGTLSADKVEYNGHWDDIDDVNFWKSDASTLFYDILYNGDFPYSHTTSADIPTQELHIKINIPAFDPLKGATATLNGFAWASSWFPWLKNQFTRAAQTNERFEDKVYLQFGLGWYQSLFEDAPIAPRWTVPGDWTLAKGTHWALPTRDLVFQGASLGVTLKF